MQFKHFDGSITNVPSIGTALSVLERKDDWRNPENTTSTGRVVVKPAVSGDEETGRVTVTERTTVVGEARDYDVLPELTGRDNYTDPEESVQWIETEYGKYNDNITRRYHAHLLNVYRDKQGVMRVGSVRISHVDSEVTATCVKCKAYRTLDTEANFYGLGYDLDLMQDFTARVIAHGHNHSAAWVTKTPIG